MVEKVVAVNRDYCYHAKMRIDKILKEKQTISFEFFPPKEVSQESVLFDTIEKLAPFVPDFVSITYGAGGTGGGKTFDWTKTIHEKYNLTTMMHLTCYGNNPADVDDICGKMLENGVDNVLALRGDPPKDAADVKNHFKYANELVEYIHNKYPDISIGVAGYPEKHTQAPDMAADIQNLHKKIVAGGQYIVSQLFFDNDHFYRYRDNIIKIGVNVPLLAGIMPIVGYSQVLKFTQMCGATIPSKLLTRLEKAAPEDAVKIGAEHAAIQCEDLIKQDVSGIHYYTLNRYTSVYDVLKQLERA